MEGLSLLLLKCRGGRLKRVINISLKLLPGDSTRVWGVYRVHSIHPQE